MKKIIILGVALLILVTGCGTEQEQKMICTRTSNINGVKIDLRYEVTYQGNNVNKVESTEKVESDSKETLNTYKEAVENLYSNFDNIENYKYNVIIEGYTLTSTVNIDYTKIDINELLEIDSSVQQLLNDNKKVDLDKITQVYESAGAVCEVK